MKVLTVSKRMSRVFALLLAALTVMSLVSCSGDINTDNEIDIVPQTQAPTAEPTVEPTVEPTIEPTVEPTIEPTTAPTMTADPEDNKTVMLDTPHLGEMTSTEDFFKKASSDSSKVKGARQIGKGESVLILGTQGRYYKVEYSFLQGFVPMDKVNDKGETSADAFRAIPSFGATEDIEEKEYKTSTLVYFRVNPYKTSQRVDGCLELEKGARVKVNGKCGDYYRCKFGDYKGYILISDLREATAGDDGGEGGDGSYSVQHVIDKYNWAHGINKECIGWISVPGTIIDAPVLYRAGSGYYYDNHDLYGNTLESTKRYTIYSYCGVNNKVVTIAGHNMRKSGKGFHALHDVRDRLRNNPSGDKTVYLKLGEYTKWEIWACFETERYAPESTFDYLAKNPNPSDMSGWISYVCSRSEANLGSASASDKIVVLVTCARKSGDGEWRLYTFLKAVS